MAQVAFDRPELPYEVNEELKVLRTNLQFCGDDKQVILFTSAFSGEGKSTVSLNIAEALTEIGKTVLLLDADMRKSQFRRRVKGAPPKKGLSLFLSGQCELKDIIFNTNIDNLSVIFAGTVPPNPTELLSAPRFKVLLQAAKESYDYVIIDCPPIGMVVDAAVVAPQCDGSVLILEAGEVKYRLAQEVVQKLRGTGTPILGVVLNKVDRKKHGAYYRRYYGKRYTQYYEHSE